MTIEKFKYDAKNKDGILRKTQFLTKTVSYLYLYLFSFTKTPAKILHCNEMRIFDEPTYYASKKYLASRKIGLFLTPTIK